MVCDFNEQHVFSVACSPLVIVLRSDRKAGAIWSRSDQKDLIWQSLPDILIRSVLNKDLMRLENARARACRKHSNMFSGAWYNFIAWDNENRNIIVFSISTWERVPQGKAFTLLRGRRALNRAWRRGSRLIHVEYLWNNKMCVFNVFFKYEYGWFRNSSLCNN